jgi:hypothetical protein
VVRFEPNQRCPCSAFASGLQSGLMTEKTAPCLVWHKAFLQLHDSCKENSFARYIFYANNRAISSRS